MLHLFTVFLVCMITMCLNPQSNSQDFISNSPYCLPYNLSHASLENLELDQLMNYGQLADGPTRRSTVLTFHGQATDKLPTGYRHITNSRSTVGRQSADSWSSVGRQVLPEI